MPGFNGELRKGEGMAISTAYLAWRVAAQQQVNQIASASLASQGIRAESLRVTPTAFNTVLWRAVAGAGGVG